MVILERCDVLFIEKQGHNYFAFTFPAFKEIFSCFILFFSHCFPLYPQLQSQTYVPPTSLHFPPLKHGNEEQGDSKQKKLEVIF